MFGLNKNRKSVEVRQTMNRFVKNGLDTTVQNQEFETEKREQARCGRLIPMLFTPVLETEEQLVSQLAPAVSQDLSSEGFSLLSFGPLEAETVLAVITDPLEIALLHCEVRHSRHIGYGYYLRGIKVKEKLRWGPFAKLKLAVEEYNMAYEPNLLEQV